MEDNLAELCNFDLLKKEGKKYYTNIPIFTKEFSCEVSMKTVALRENIADILTEAVTSHESEVRSIGFAGADMKNNSYAWQAVSSILFMAVIDILQSKIKITYPKDKFECECFVWGTEVHSENKWKEQFGFGISGASNERGDFIRFMDFPVNGEMVHHYFSGNQNITNVFLDIARGNTDSLTR